MGKNPFSHKPPLVYATFSPYVVSCLFRLVKRGPKWISLSLKKNTLRHKDPSPAIAPLRLRRLTILSPFLVPKIPKPESSSDEESQTKPRLRLPPSFHCTPACAAPARWSEPAIPAPRRDGMKSPLRRFRGFSHHHRERKDHAPPPAKLDELVYAAQVRPSAPLDSLYLPILLPSAVAPRWWCDCAPKTDRAASSRARDSRRVRISRPVLTAVALFLLLAVIVWNRTISAPLWYAVPLKQNCGGMGTFLLFIC